MIRTIEEAAAELRLSPRRIRQIVVANGLYIAAPNSNRRRITDDQFQSLVAPEDRHANQTLSPKEWCLPLARHLSRHPR
jgi:DNA-binding cell septation regulator SpoVG